MGLIAGTHVWDELHDLVAAAVRRRAAIAYAGRHAAELMPLGAGDLVVVDGSDGVLAAGSTHPDALAAWIAADAHVWSLHDLHAKVLLLVDTADVMTAVIGSANVSAHSNNNLLEAVIVTDDHTVCEAVSGQLDLWTALATRIDNQWLIRARAIYKEPRTSGRRAATPRLCIDTTAPLWLGKCEPTTDQGSTAAQAAYDQAMRTYDRVGDVSWWELNRGDEDLVHPEQNVVLVNNPSQRIEPVGRANVWAPAKIVRVVPSRRRHLPVAILVRPPDSRTARFSQVRRAVEQSGEQLDWSRILGPKAAAYVYQLWP